MSEFKTVQQYYASAGAKPLSGEDAKQFTLKFPEGLPVYKFQHTQLNVFDIIPFKVVNEAHPFVASGRVEPDGETVDDIFMYYEHVINKRGDAVPCNRMLYGTDCPICEERQRKIDALKAKGIKEYWKDEGVKALKPKAKIMANVIDNRNREAGVQVLAGSEFVIRQGVLNGAKVNRGDEEDKNSVFLEQGQTFTLEVYDPNIKANKLSEHLYFASPTNGFSIEVECVPDTYDGHDYAKPIRFSLRNRKQQYTRDIVDKAYDLPSFIVQRSYDEVKKLFYGVQESPNVTVETNASLNIEQKAPVAEAPKPVVQEAPKPVVQEAPKPIEVPKPAEVRMCKHGYRIGLDFETKAECSDCLDENTKEYSECRKVRRTIQSL